MVIMCKNLIIINYDLMSGKCRNCSHKEESDMSDFRLKELYFCSRNKTFINEYKKHGEDLCLKCFEDFIVENINLNEYELWQIS